MAEKSLGQNPRVDCGAAALDLSGACRVGVVWIVARGWDAHHAMSRIEELLSELKDIDAADRGAFPYEDCRKLQQVSGADASLIPDLDTYLSEIAGYRSWGRRVGGWADEKIDEVGRRIDASFFDRFPAHSALRDAMESDEFANLRGVIARADRTRAVLRDLLREIRPHGKD